MASKKLAIERFDLSIVALLEGCSKRLSYTALHFSLSWVLVILQYQFNIMVTKKIGNREARPFYPRSASAAL